MLKNTVPFLKLLSLALWIASWYPPVWIAVKLKKFALRDRMVQLCNRGLLYIIGIRLRVLGELSDIRPLLLVTNHISYLDILILASRAPVCFTPKSEIAAWPVIGNIARLIGSVFIDRRPEKMVEMKQGIHAALATGRVVSLFPEATTGNGLHMQPFKSGLFSLADEDIDGRPLTLQPACITYTHIRSLPITSPGWPTVAWYGDMFLAPHAWELLKLGPIAAVLSFLPPVTMQPFGDRKKLAQHCREAIYNKLQSFKQ